MRKHEMQSQLDETKQQNRSLFDQLAKARKATSREEWSSDDIPQLKKKVEALEIEVARLQPRSVTGCMSPYDLRRSPCRYGCPCLVCAPRSGAVPFSQLYNAYYG